MVCWAITAIILITMTMHPIFVLDISENFPTISLMDMDAAVTEGAVEGM